MIKILICILMSAPVMELAIGDDKVTAGLAASSVGSYVAFSKVRAEAKLKEEVLLNEMGQGKVLSPSEVNQLAARMRAQDTFEILASSTQTKLYRKLRVDKLAKLKEELALAKLKKININPAFNSLDFYQVDKETKKLSKDIVLLEEEIRILPETGTRKAFGFKTIATDSQALQYHLKNGTIHKVTRLPSEVRLRVINKVASLGLMTSIASLAGAAYTLEVGEQGLLNKSAARLNTSDRNLPDEAKASSSQIAKLSRVNSQ
jgi:hypothetical protein